MKRLRGLLSALALATLAGPIPAGAASITLGDQDFASGSLISLGTFTAAQVGEPAPIGAFIGNDIAGTFFSASWTFNFAPGAVGSASITFGIFDHDSAATGQQLASFSVDGVDLTAALNALFEAPGIGTQQQDDVFTLALSGAALAALADGSATFSLTLQGPALCGNAGTTIDCTTQGNGAGLDFSRLEYTQAAAPEPTTLALFAVALAAIAWSRRRRAR